MSQKPNFLFSAAEPVAINCNKDIQANVIWPVAEYAFTHTPECPFAFEVAVNAYGKLATWRGEICQGTAGDGVYTIRLQLPVISPLWIATEFTSSSIGSLRIVDSQGNDSNCPRDVCFSDSPTENHSSTGINIRDSQGNETFTHCYSNSSTNGKQVSQNF